jgi:integrase
LLVATIRKMTRRAWYSADLLELLAYSGMRLHEATALKWQHIDFEKKELTVTGGEDGTKNLKERTIPLFPSLKKFLLVLQEKRRKQLKLLRLDEFQVVPILNAKTALNSACEEAKLPHFNHHHLRHFFCSNAIEAGVDFRTIAGWLGHSDGGVLVAKVYGHLRDEHSRAMAAKMTFTVAA